MRCPYCNEDEDRVVDTRSSREGGAVRRRRECLRCGRRFTTYEYVEERQLQVRKRDGTLEPFDRQKLLRAVQLACAKRPVGLSEIEALVEAAEDAMHGLGRDEIPSREIGEQVMQRLKGADHVSYVRFASVYRDFKDIDEFFDEVRELQAHLARLALKESQAELPLEAE
ncbi:MAG: transcriptional regulator NrdR [Longimicrobiales bacterium]